MNKQDYISHKIKKLREQEGKSQPQSVAIALSMAEKKYQEGGPINYNVQPYTPYIPFPGGDFQYAQPQYPEPYTPYVNPIFTEQVSQAMNMNNQSSYDWNPYVTGNFENNPATQYYSQPNSTYNPSIESTPETQYRDINKNLLYNPYQGINLETALFTLGQSLNYKGENKGANTLRGIASAGKVALGGARTLLSGAGYQNRQQNVYNEFMNNLYNPKISYTSYQQGGEVTNADVMTGAYVVDSPNPTVEVESGEHTLNSQTGNVQEVIGEKHDNGGVKTNLPSGSRVLSDYTKIGAQKAKLFRKELDVKVKATDTFATVMDKYNNKIGVTDAIEDEKETIEEVGNQQQSDIDSTTKDLNMNFLSEKMQEVQQEKENLKPLQQEAFNFIFSEQEKLPKKDNQNSKQEGGYIDPQIQQLAEQYNLSPEKVIELLQQQSPPQGNDLQNKVMQALQQGTDPQQVMQYLAQNGVPEDQAQQLIQQVSQPPQMQGGGTITVSDKNDPRYRAYKDSLNAYNSTASQVANAKKYISNTGEGEFIPGVFSNNQRVAPIGAYFGIGAQFINEYAKPTQKVILDTTPQVSSVGNINPAGIKENNNSPSGELLPIYPETNFKTYGQDRFQNVWRAQGTTASAEERKANPEWNKDVQMIYLKDPETLGVQRTNDGRYATYNDSYKNLVEGQDYIIMREGGELSKMQPGGIVPPDFFNSPYATTEFGYQPYTEGTTNASGLTEEQILQRLQYQQQSLPYLVQQSGIYSDNAGPFPNLNNTGAFQQGYDTYTDTTIRAIDQNPNLTAEQKQAMSAVVQAQKLGLSKKTGQFDKIYGLETSSRTGFSIPYLTEADRAKYQDIKRIGDVVDENGKIKSEYSQLDPQTQKQILATYELGKESRDIGLGVIPTVAQQQTSVENIPIAQTETVNRYNTNLSMSQFPVDFILPPSPVSPAYKGSATLGRIAPVNVSIEPNLIEADRQRQSTQKALEFLPDSQRAGALAALLGQTQTATNQAISNAEQINAQAQNQADQINLQQSDKQQLLDNQFNQLYEQNMYQALSNTQRDLQNYFTTLNLGQRQNFADVRDLNLLNQMYPQYSSNGQYVQFNDTPLNLGNSAYNTNAMTYFNRLSPEDKAKYTAQMMKSANKKK